MAKRPDDLPDFASPPLNEVVLGVQFTTPRGYQQIYAGDVWSLFRDRFPTVEELNSIPPMFETFGLPQAGKINFGIVTGASHDRFWFLSPAKEQLIQFQHDRLLHNWRKIGDQTNPYPRFDKIAADFEGELKALENFFQAFQAGPLQVNQCEISYINHIKPDDNSHLQPSDWINIIDESAFMPDDFSLTCRRTIRRSDGKPRGRLVCEAATAADEGGAQFLALNLTARGAPDEHTIASAFEFLNDGRDIIVRQFAKMTTDSAHQRWGRIR